MEFKFEELNKFRMRYADDMIREMNSDDSVLNYYDVGDEFTRIQNLYETPPMGSEVFEQLMSERLRINLENAVWNASYKFKALEDKFNHKAIFKFADEQMLKFNKETKSI